MLGFEHGRNMVGKVGTFMVCGWFLFESAKDRFLEVDPEDNMCCHVSDMKQHDH
jgi:hypothetical protein